MPNNVYAQDYALTQDFEGFGLPNRPGQLYYDTKGNPTIGWGFNLNNKNIKKKIGNKTTITEEEALPIFIELYNNAQRDAVDLAGGDEAFAQLPPTAQIVLTDMSYNMGKDKLAGFVQMFKSLKKKDWEGVSREMQDSNWYGQVGRRSKKLQSMINSLIPQKVKGY